MPARKSHRRPGPPGSVRLIAGQWRGRRLPVPDSPGLRPTPDRVRETVFNWLAPRIEGSRCLDLFAGSGALGLEAASRGAGQVHLLDRDAAVVTGLRDNAARLAAGDRIRIEQADAMAFLERTPERPYDVVFVDPPYDAGVQAEVVDKLARGGWLSDDSLVYVEWPADQAPAIAGQPWRQSRAGAVAYALYHPPAPYHPPPGLG